jgi:hypothetical protein
LRRFGPAPSRRLSEHHANKRIKSFCIAQPMQKLGWTEPLMG